MKKVHHRQCAKCEFEYELMEHQRYNADLGAYEEPQLFALQGNDPDWQMCPRCGCEIYRERFAVSNFSKPRNTDRRGYLARCPDVGENELTQSHFPYFDEGLGEVLQSPEHRQFLMTHHKDGTPREDPLVCIGTDTWDPIAQCDRQLAERKEIDQKWDLYLDELKSQPETRKALAQFEDCARKKDFSSLGWDLEYPEPTHYPPAGEGVLQDEEGYLYTESGWRSDNPQPWVPQALIAAGHAPRLPDPERDLLPDDQHRRYAKRIEAGEWNDVALLTG